MKQFLVGTLAICMLVVAGAWAEHFKRNPVISAAPVLDYDLSKVEYQGRTCIVIWWTWPGGRQPAGISCERSR